LPREEELVIPTGIKSIDLLAGGGIAAGSLILLYGPAQTFKSEFLATTAFVNAALKEGHLTPPRRVKVPKEIWYVNFSKTPQEILSSVKTTFSKRFFEIFKRNVKFLDQSKEYSALVGSMWEKKKAPDTRKFLLQLVNSLKKIGPDSQIFIYTLTDIARLLQDKPLEFLSFMEGLRSASHGWKGLVCGILRKGALPPALEEDILSASDGTFYFDVEKAGGTDRYTLTVLALAGVPTSALGRVFEVSVGPDGFHAEAVKSVLGI
jgi:archaellum biogenesis ATPase FlaH